MRFGSIAILSLSLLLLPGFAAGQEKDPRLPSAGHDYAPADTNPIRNATATTFGRGWVHERPPVSLGDTKNLPITYRGVGNKDPGWAFNEGFRPKGTNTNLLQHQMEKKPAGVGESFYVSTSKDRGVAEHFVQIRHGKDGHVYDIQAPGIDVNEALGKKSIYPKEQEIAVAGGIAPSDIRGVYDVKDGKVTGYRKNPLFHAASWSSDPVVARDHYGALFDKRTGRAIREADAKEAMDRADLYATPTSVTILEKDASGATGIDAGPFRNGRATLVEGSLGEVHVDALRLDGTGQARAGITKDGVAANVFLDGRATLLGVGAQSRTFGLGDPEALTSATAQGSADAFVGAEALLDANASVTRHGVQGNVHAGAFVGGKAEADGTGQVSICGVQVNALAHGEASYGLGADAAGYFKVDWSSMSVKVGGRAALTAGVGAGAGGEVEVSLAKLMKDPRAAGRCMVDGAKTALTTAGHALAEGAGAVKNAIASGAHKLCFWCKDDPKPAAPATAPFNRGTNIGRNARTIPPAAGVPGARTPVSVRHGAGVAH